MNQERTPRRKAATPDYPDVGEIRADRRSFLRLFAGIVAGMVAAPAVSCAHILDDPPVPGGMQPAPPDPSVPEPEPVPQQCSGGDPEPDDDKHPDPEPDPEEIPLPGEPPVIPETPEYELEGDVAMPLPPTPED